MHKTHPLAVQEHIRKMNFRMVVAGLFDIQYLSRKNFAFGSNAINV